MTEVNSGSGRGLRFCAIARPPAAPTCPPWCELTQHVDPTVHAAHVGLVELVDDDPIQVRLLWAQNGGRDHNTPQVIVSSSDGAASILSAWNARTLADLFRTLGHDRVLRELAGHLDRAASTLERHHS